MYTHYYNKHIPERIHETFICWTKGPSQTHLPAAISPLTQTNAVIAVDVFQCGKPGRKLYTNMHVYQYYILRSFLSTVCAWMWLTNWLLLEDSVMADRGNSHCVILGEK